MKLFWLVSLVSALALSLFACGGEEKTARTLDDADLREMVLITTEGLPWAISLKDDQAMSDQATVEDVPDPEQWLENYEKWGRMGGHHAEFRQETESDLAVQTEVEYYESTDGAKSAWAAIGESLLSEETHGYLENEGFAELVIEEMAAKKVGDESSAFRMEFKWEDSAFETLTILLRRDSIVAFASVGEKKGVLSIDDAVAVAEQLDSRIQDVLSR